MHTNAKVTWYSKGDYSRKVYDAYIEKEDTRNSKKEGDVKSHALFIIIPTLVPIDFSLGDFIVLGNVSEIIDGSSEKNESESIKALKQKHRLYTIETISPCLDGSRRMWHYEVECD